jgi:hypothetical protein
VNFGSLIPISDHSFAFPLHVEKVFFSRCDYKERGWKLVLGKDPHGRQITESIQLNPTEFDMFRVGNADDYSGLQVPVSIQETNQLPNIAGGFIVNAIDLNADDSEGNQDNGFDSLEDYASDNSNDA